MKFLWADAKRLPRACAALIVGGWDRGSRGKGHFGVRLDLTLEP